MEGLNLVSTFAEFKEHKNIDRPTMMSVLEDVFRTQLAKMYGTADNCDIIINIDKGDFEIWRNRTIVENVEDPNTEVSLEEARQVDDSYEVGEDFTEEVKLSAFGRRGILNIRQNLSGKIMEIEKTNLYKAYKERIGEIFVGEVYHAWKKEVLILDEDGNELVLPKSEQIPSDFFRKGDSVKSVVANVELRNNNPIITLSRTSPLFLERLFEQEVPEIADGLITIKKVVRVPGERAKVAVESYDDRIDPIGACIGVKGGRITGIVNELRHENIDVIPWSQNPTILIQRALNPAEVSRIDLGESAEDKVKVYMRPDQVSKGIGRHGVNIQLAGMLLGREIEVYREFAKGEEDEEDDVLLRDFADVIDSWVIDRLEEIGCDTARSVLALSPEDIAKRADLEDETVADVIEILKAEFED